MFYQIKRTESPADSDLVFSKVLPALYFDKDLAMEAAAAIAFEMRPYHPAYPSNVYDVKDKDAVIWLSKYGRFVEFEVIEEEK